MEPPSINLTKPLTHKQRCTRSKKKKDITILYNNINGVKSKYNSLRNILEKVNPTIVALCETKLGRLSKMQKVMPGYKLYPRYVKQGKGGLLIGIKRNTFRSTLNVTSSDNRNILAVRISVSERLAYRVILAYGPQETESLEVREGFITEVSVELQNCSDNSDVPILLGDFNAKLNMEDGVLCPLSGNGRLLGEMVSKFDMEVLNFSEVCDGKWTHVIRTTGAKSVLDYAISSKQFVSSVKSMIIDEDCVFCPFSIKARKRDTPVEIFSDHNTITLDASVVMPKKNKSDNLFKWKLLDEGKVKLMAITAEESYVPPPKASNPQLQYDNFEQETNKLLEATALKIKIKDKVNKADGCPNRFLEIFQLITKFGARGKIQRRVAANYKKAILELNKSEVRRDRANCLKKAITSLSINGRFSRQEFWKVRRSIYQKYESCSSVMDSKGHEVLDEVLIKKAYEDEFKSRLSHRTMDPLLKQYEMKTNLLAELYVEEATMVKGPPITPQELDRAIDQLKKGSTGSDNIPTDFYTTIGQGFKAYLLDVLNDLKEASCVPSQWEMTLITTIYKNKGTRKVLRNYRGIFLTQIISKLYERIMVGRKKDIMNSSTKLQAGSKTNRGPLDQMFLLQGGIDHAKHMNVPLFVTVYDFAQCFDALWLEDCIVSLWKLGIQDETLTTLYNMNKKATIQVKTPIGMTNKFSRDTIVKQGTVSGPPMCSTSIAEFVESNKVRGFPIGGTSISTMILVDDVLNANLCPDDVIKSHENMENFSKLKRAPLNGTKCFLLPVNAKQQFIIPCLKHGKIDLEVVEKVLYLGNMFNRKGDNKDKINDREQKAMTCMVESLSLCNEVTLGIYTIQSLLLAHDMIFVPTLSYGAQTWTNLTAEDERILKTSQLRFLKRILRAPNSACNSIVFLELGVLPVTAEIIILKLTFLHHILTLEDDDPVKQVYVEQLKIPGEKNWGNEIKRIRNEYELTETDEEIYSLTKDEWKFKVMELVKEKTIIELNQEKNSLSKSSSYPDAEYLLPSRYLYHFTASHSCLLFRLRCRIIDIKEVQRYKYEEDMSCRGCENSMETVEHVLGECTALSSQPCAGGDEYSDSIETAEKVICRVKEFMDLVDEQEEEHED